MSDSAPQLLAMMTWQHPYHLSLASVLLGAAAPMLRILTKIYEMRSRARAGHTGDKP